MAGNEGRIRAAAGLVAFALLGLAPACSEEEPPVYRSLEPAVAMDQDPAPDVVEVSLVAERARMRYLPDGDAEVWGYRDAGQPGSVAKVPGPTIVARLGERVVVRFENQLPEGTTVHWHGMRVPNMADGTPSTQMEVPPGGTFVYEFVASDAGTFWYHPHVRADVQVERGLYGMLLVRGGEDIPVEADRAFVLDDVKLDASGRLSDRTDSLDLMVGRRGNVLLVNGQQGGTIRSKSGARERWRFVNSANGRYFKLRLPGHVFTVVAWDGGLLPKPYDTETLLITPGERYEVLVTLQGPVGGSIALETIHYDRGHALPDPGPQRLLRIALEGTATATGPLPAVWAEMSPIETGASTRERKLVLDEIGGRDMSTRTTLVILLAALGASSCGGHESGDEPNPPSDLMVSEMDRGAHLTWKDNSDNEGSFMLERKVGTGNFAVYKTLDFNTTVYHDADVTSGMTYGYRVMAMPKSGSGHTANTQYSNEVTFTPGS